MPELIRIQSVVRTHKILLDTSFAMHPGFVQFTRAFDYAFLRNPILIPAVVLWELRKHCWDTRRTFAARNALKQLSLLVRSQRAEFRFEHCDRFQDLVILRVTLQHQLSRNIAVLTNDTNLMLDLRAIWSSRSVQTHRNLRVLKFLHSSNRVGVFD